MTDRQQPNPPPETGVLPGEQPEPAKPKEPWPGEVLSAYLYLLPVRYQLPGRNFVLVDRDLAAQADPPPAEVDASPSFDLVDRSHWPDTLTWLLVSGFAVTIVTAVVVVAFDAAARIAIISMLIGSLTTALLRLALVRLRGSARLRRPRHTGRSERDQP
jgi:hypothetical protein